MKSQEPHDPAPIEPGKPSRTEFLAELERIRAMTLQRKSGVIYPTAEQLVRESRNSR